VIRFDCVTLFPQMFAAVTDWGITRRALELGAWSIALWNPRDFTTDNYRTVDDRPYGGGPGMVMLAEPLEKAIDAAKSAARNASGGAAKVVHLSPQGKVLDHAKVRELAHGQGLVLLCGRYEGVDERLVARCVDEEVSIGDYVISGGELAAMALIDAVVRQLPGVLGDEQSAEQDSFANGLLDCPHYTRPDVYEGVEVPAYGPPGQEVGPRGLELPCTRSTEDKPHTAILDVTVDFVQQRGKALHFVHDDEGPGRQAAQLSREGPDVGKVGLVERLVEQVDPMGPGKDATEPGALAHAARPEEKERPPGRSYDSRVDHTAHIAAILSRKTTTYNQAVALVVEKGDHVHEREPLAAGPLLEVGHEARVNEEVHLASSATRPSDDPSGGGTRGRGPC